MSDNTFPTPDELRFAADVVERVHADCPNPTLVWSSAYGLRAEATRIEDAQAEQVQREREIEAVAKAMRGASSVLSWDDITKGSRCMWRQHAASAIDALDKLRGDRGE